MEFENGQVIETKENGKHVCLENQLYEYDESKNYLPYHRYAPGFLVNIYNSYVLVYYYNKGDFFDTSSYKTLAFYLLNYKCLYKTKNSLDKMVFLVHHKKNKYYFISDRILYFETPEDDIIVDFNGKIAKGIKYDYIITDTVKFLKTKYQYYYCPNIKEIANSIKYWRKNPYRYENPCLII